MSVAEAAHRPAGTGRAVKLWLGFLVIIAAGVGLAWLGAQSVRSRTVQVETVEAGSGPRIGPQDGVLIDYEGRLENGTVFDSNEGKGPVPVLVGQVIPGFTQALVKMQKGGRYRIHIPSKLAYGATPPAGGPIPPNADLEFDVHVAQVVPNAALMQGGPQQ
ncbi:MAG: FKBP-type peptidyl-prolyl cis-trans isomerase [Sphingomicrobium sp.]